MMDPFPIEYSNFLLAQKQEVVSRDGAALGFVPTDEPNFSLPGRPNLVCPTDPQVLGGCEEPPLCFFSSA